MEQILISEVVNDERYVDEIEEITEEEWNEWNEVEVEVEEELPEWQVAAEEKYGIPPGTLELFLKASAEAAYRGY